MEASAQELPIQGGTPATADLKRLAYKVGRFDAVVSMLTSLTLIAGVIMLFLVAAWVTTQVWFSPNSAAKIDVLVLGGEGEEGAAGDSPEALGPGDVDASEDILLADNEVEQAPPSDSIASVIEAVELQTQDMLDPALPRGDFGQGNKGNPGGTGRKGSGTGGGGAIPVSERWLVRYTNNQSLEGYAQLLDYFGIELGVLKADKMVYVNKLAGKNPVIRNGDGRENRLFFAWQDAGRRQADQELLKRCGVSADNNLIVHFYPQKLEENLSKLERSFKNKDPKDIKRTTYGIRRAGDGYEFFVINQSLKAEGNVE